MAGYNRIVLVGNLTRDPEYKQLASGQAVCKLGLATNRQFKNRQSGAMVQEVCYIDVDVWGAQAESCRQYLQKGRSVLIEGRLKLDTWEDANGQNRSKHSIVADRVVFLGGAGMEDTMHEGEAELTMTPSSSSSSKPMSGAVRGGDFGAMSPQPQSPMEKELFDQIDQIKVRNAKKQTKKSSDTGELNFKDEPPFEDELPF